MYPTSQKNILSPNPPLPFKSILHMAKIKKKSMLLNLEHQVILYI